MSKQQDPQEKFENIVNNGKSIIGAQFFVDVPLSGEINLSILKDRGVDEIHFADGEITRIYNVPRGIKTLVINNNRLESLPTAELKDLVNLEADNNRITKADLKDMVSLHSLSLKSNKLASIVHFPKSLHTLSLEQNQLKELNLAGCESCVRVNTLNNLSLRKIYNAPVSNHNFELTKDEHTQLSSNNKHADEKTMIADVKHAVDTYYALKNKYEQEKQATIKEIMVNKSKTRNQKIRQVRHTQYKCVNCKQVGGTKFWKDEDNNLRAVCGNATMPCNLNISILSSLTISPQEMRAEAEQTDKSKQEIIQLKMDTLFGYIDSETSVKRFNENIKIINDNATVVYEPFIENPEKKKIVNKKMQDIYGELAMIRKLRHEYSMTNNKELLRDIVSHHKNVKTNLDNIRSLKYPITEMVDEEQKQQHVLKQFPYSFDEYLNPNLELLKVNKFTI
jgi:hypothetical protein